jgi:hypothetical protein
MHDWCLLYGWSWLHKAVTKRAACWAGTVPWIYSLQLSFLAAYPALSALFYLRASAFTHLSFYPVGVAAAIRVVVVCLRHKVVLRQAATSALCFLLEPCLVRSQC